MKKFLPFVLIFSFLIISGLGCKQGLTTEQQNAIKPVTLNYWRVLDDSDSFGEIISAYQALHPNITINYRKLRIEEFETELLNALAEDRGPDMFSIQNDWIRKYQSKIYPLPATVKEAFQSMQGTLQKQLVVDIKTVTTPSVKNIQDRYIAAVADNVIIPTPDPATGKINKLIYGLPLSVDTLALYYNKDMLDQAGIAEAPKTWTDFQKDVIAITKIDQQNNILRAGAALGTSKNVDRAGDILSVLMMQNGVQMTSDNGYPTFNQTPAGWSGGSPPADQALQFYTDFAQPTKQVYSWNSNMPNSLDAFTRGQAAFYIGYGYNQAFIKARAPKLNYNVVSLPQINPEHPVNFGLFWNETVSKKTKSPDEAWGFLVFASDPKNVVKYLNKTGKTTALRELIPTQMQNSDLAVFANQLLTAKTWYKGKDAVIADKYFTTMIDTVLDKSSLNDPAAYRKAVENAAAQVSQTM